ncbi:hypothetical protein [Sporisorium scitamineum]|uniref:Uncharacterized protein n=1 Tax=Sporisorium scitamineum TaxID=49012 RepID=A0A0F7RVJ0_9BASI|nr:hypothetical protein [Sporisorium scitamineum]
MAGPAVQAAKNKARQVFMKNWDDYGTLLKFFPSTLSLVLLPVVPLEPFAAPRPFSMLSNNLLTPKSTLSLAFTLSIGTNTKLMSVNQQFERQYKRDRL